MAKDSRIGITGGGGASGRASVGKSAVPSKEYRARKAAGITNNGGKNVTPIYKESVPPLPQGAPKVKYSPNVTVQAPGKLGKMETHIDLHYHPKYSK